MRLRLLGFFVFFITNFLRGKCLKLVKLDVPSMVDPRQEKVRLRCDYELDRGEKLYSVKWSKDANEFFRFMPGVIPPGVDFHVDEVQVSLEDSNDKVVTLIQRQDGYDSETNVLGGSYGCEVSTDAPNFLVKFDVANMSIAVLPQRDPVLEGLRSHYDVGDILDAECTAAPSYPPADLTFQLNNMEVKRALTRQLPDVGHVEGNVVSTTRLGLSLPLERRYFNPSGSLILTCRSILPGVPGAKSRETNVIVLLAANNERLAQEAPKISSSAHHYHFNYLIIPAVIIMKF